MSQESLPVRPPGAGLDPQRRPSRRRARLRRYVLRFTAGGRWTDHLPPPVRVNLRWFWLDGTLAQASDSIVVAYLSVFLLALGGSRAQVGLLSSLSSLSAALVLLPGAALVERWGRRKQLTLLSGGTGARLMLLLMALAPLVFQGPAVIGWVVGLAVVRSALGQLSLPAWTSLTADIVPLAWRGRYFASRNMAMGVAGMIVTYLVGQLVTLVGGPGGYQWALALAFAVGMASTWSFGRLTEPASAPVARAGEHTDSLGKTLRANRDFLAFCGVAALWNFALNVSGPFFSPYLVEGLSASAAMVGLLSVASSLGALPGQRLFGVLADRWGPRRVQLVTSLVIPILPLAWTLTRSPWHAVPINLLGGFLWAGFDLASFSYLLTLTPQDRRARFTAIYQIVVMGGLAAGAAVGGIAATQWGYATTFVLSGVGRLGAALLFAWLVQPPGRRPAASAPRDTTAKPDLLPDQKLEQAN